MSNKQKSGKTAMHVAIYILLITWVVLLALLIGIYVLRLQGYDNFTEWKNRNQQTTDGPTIVTPEPTAAATPVLSPGPTKAPTVAPTATTAPTPAVTVTSTVTPTPTETPLPTEPPVEEMIFSGKEGIDAKLREKAAELFTEEEEICYVSYETGIYFSVVFQKGEQIVPVVYNLTTEEQVLGSDLIKETYMAVIKERLQTYVAEKFPETAESEFVSYKQVYQVEDYQLFYLTEDQLAFYFEEGVLTENQKAFSYAVELSEAQAFFRNNLDGSANGPGIRELDPNAKMIAITFDDGPFPKVEEQILELFEQYNGRATFFFLGHRVEEWFPDMPGIAYAAGHEVGSHTYSHELDFSSASAEEIWSEINRANLAIAKSTGFAPEYVRFPGGSYGKRSQSIPMIAVNWNMDSVDYREKKKEDGGDIIFNRLKDSSKLGDGSIVLMHSIYQNSYEGIAKFVEYVTSEGYELVTLSELFYYKGIDTEFGLVYYDGNGTIGKKK